MQFIDLNAQYALLKPKIDARIQQVLDHGMFINGPEVREFEARLQEFVGIKHAIACANGTDALVLGLMAMGIKQGDGVLCPSFTFFATAEAIAACGAVPVFVDCDTGTFNICPESLEETITEVHSRGEPELKAIVTVDLFGLPADYPAIIGIAENYNLKILEDAAQGFGGEINGVRAGRFGEIATTSFFPAKPLGCYGDGGAIFTDNDAYAGIIRSLASHGKGADKYDNIRIGMNSRLDTIQAAVLLEKMQVFMDERARRNEVAQEYGKHLGDFVQTPLVPEGYISSWAQYTIKSAERDKIKNQLAQKDIPSMIYYQKCMHQQTAFLQTGVPSFKPRNLERSEQLARQVLSLPLHPYLTDKQIQTISEALKAGLT